MSETVITVLINAVLVVFGAIQLIFLRTQKKHTRIALTEQYRQLWNDLKKHWGNIVFIGREMGEYYQVLDETSIHNLEVKTNKHRLDTPTIWALESIQKVSGALGEVSTRILQGHLNIADIYPIFGTQFLRQSRPLRLLLEPEYEDVYFTNETTEQHELVRKEIQDWLIYHDGLRRRCLILIDLLWAEAARLEDLPPYDMKSGADAKKQTGQLNRKRVFYETLKLNGITKIFLSFRLSRFLRRAEYSSLSNWVGLNEKQLSNLDDKWVKRLLRDNE